MAAKSVFVVDNGAYMSKSKMSTRDEARCGEPVLSYFNLRLSECFHLD